MLAGFRAPSWSEPIDVEQRISRTPESATIRGLFLQMIVDSAKAAGVELPGPKSYSTFVPYPMRDYMGLAVAAAKQRFAGEAMREGLRRVGHTVYPEFKQTMVGSAIFAFAADDFLKVAGLAQKAYAVSLNVGAVSIRELATRHIVVELRDVHNFAECLQVGVWEGALKACRATGDVYIRAHTASDVDLEIEWR
jgi:uncharacterized protein (TIGR02265 family)